MIDRRRLAGRFIAVAALGGVSMRPFAQTPGRSWRIGWLGFTAANTASVARSAAAFETSDPSCFCTSSTNSALVAAATRAVRPLPVATSAMLPVGVLSSSSSLPPHALTIAPTTAIAANFKNNRFMLRLRPELQAPYREPIGVQRQTAEATY